MQSWLCYNIRNTFYIQYHQGGPGGVRIGVTASGAMALHPRSVPYRPCRGSHASQLPSATGFAGSIRSPLPQAPHNPRDSSEYHKAYKDDAA